MSPQRDPAFSFLRAGHRPPKPRARGVTEIRGPDYTVMGNGYLSDLLGMMGDHVDSLRLPGELLTRMPEDALRSLIRIANRHGVRVCADGLIEPTLVLGADVVRRHVDACARLGLDIVKISTGLASTPPDGLLRLIEHVREAGMSARLGIRLERACTRRVLEIVRRALDAGAPMAVIEPEGIRRTDVIAEIVSAFGADKLMFDAVDGEVFDWCLKTFGPEVNLFVDHSQIVQLACLRAAPGLGASA